MRVDQWLEKFAYRTTIGPELIISAGLTTVMIALVTVSYHTFRAAAADPVRSLRYE